MIEVKVTEEEIGHAIQLVIPGRREAASPESRNTEDAKKGSVPRWALATTVFMDSGLPRSARSPE